MILLLKNANVITKPESLNRDLLSIDNQGDKHMKKEKKEPKKHEQKESKAYEKKEHQKKGKK